MSNLKLNKRHIHIGGSAKQEQGCAPNLPTVMSMQTLLKCLIP